MTMTKKEHASMQAAIDKAELMWALRWTDRDAQKPDVPPPANGSGGPFTEGWSFNAHNRTVEQGWSSSVFHGSGPKPVEGKPRGSATQGPRSLFSTKKRALEALRCELELQCAKSLLEVDRRIRDVE